MKRNQRLFEIEKYFDFAKMDKNKCPKSHSQNTSY
jgi:hypothetical protein